MLPSMDGRCELYTRSAVPKKCSPRTMRSSQALKASEYVCTLPCTRTPESGSSPEVEKEEEEEEEEEAAEAAAEAEEEAAEEAAEAEAVEAEAEEAEAEAAEEEAVELEAARACTPSGSLSMRRPSAATAHSPGASKAAGQPSRK